MKPTYILLILISALIFSGCASSGGSETAASEEAAPMGDSAYTDASDTKTAYDGSTGSGLLMERYKTGAIEGFRD
jgi:PBP1b-binding outer membrane lipoprotein LpoB